VAYRDGRAGWYPTCPAELRRRSHLSRPACPPVAGEAPGQPCTVPVYDAGSGTGRLLAIDLDPGRGDVDRRAGELGQLLERLGARYVADVATSTGGRHVYVLFSSPLPWRELRDLARAIALRFPAVDPAPMCSAHREQRNAYWR
jgi:DNA primase